MNLILQEIIVGLIPSHTISIYLTYTVFKEIKLWSSLLLVFTCICNTTGFLVLPRVLADTFCPFSCSNHKSAQSSIFLGIQLIVKDTGPNSLSVYARSIPLLSVEMQNLLMPEIDLARCSYCHCTGHPWLNVQNSHSLYRIPLMSLGISYKNIGTNTV